MITGSRFCFAVAFLLAGMSKLAAEEVLIRKVIQWGDIVQSQNKEGESVSVEVELPDEAVISWQGNKLAIHTRDTGLINSGAGVWDGSAFNLYGTSNWPYPGFTHPQPNREGNPPEDPVFHSFRAVGFLPSGELVYRSRVEDDVTTQPEVFWNEIGKTGGGGDFQNLLQQNIAFPFFELAPGGDGLLAEDPELEDGKWIWWLFDDSRTTIWERDQPAPGFPELKTTIAFDRYRHPIDSKRPFTKSRHIIGIGSISPDGTGVNSVGAYFLVGPAGNKEFLFRDLGNPSPAVEGVVPAGTYGVSYLDMNENLDITMSGIIQVEGESPRAGLWLRRAGGEFELVATVGTPVQPVGSAVSTTFGFIRGVPWLDEAGNLYFDAQTEGLEGHTIWKYRAEDDLFERIGPVVGTPMPGVEGESVENAEIQALNGSGRMVAFMESSSSRGYFLQTAEGGWCPFLLDNEVLVPGDPQTLSSNFIQDPILSETNQVAFTARIDNLNTVFTVRIASEVQPEGDKYIWSGGANTNDWHTVANGRSNWVDSVGTPWPTPPGGGSRDEEVIIGSGFVVELNQPAWVHSILMDDGGNSGLVINSDLGFESLIRVPFLSELTLNSGKLESAAGILEVKGSLYKKTSGTFEMDLAILQLQGEEFQMEAGTLNIRNGETWFDGSTFTQRGGALTFQDDVTRMQGESTLLTVEAGNLNLSCKEYRLESDTTIETQSEESKIVMGRREAGAQLSFVSEEPSQIRTLRIQGPAQFEFRSPFTLTETAVLERNLTSFKPLIVNLLEGQTIQVRDNPFENKEHLLLRGGGVTGKFINDFRGLVTVEAEVPDEVVKLECQNKGRFIVKSDVEYVKEFRNLRVIDQDNPFLPGRFSGGRVHLEGVAIRPASEGTGVLIFEENSRLVVEKGDNTVSFSQTGENSFGGRLDLLEGANLHLQQARINLSFSGLERWWVHESSTLVLEDTSCYRLYVTGTGEVVVRGSLDARDEGDTRIFKVQERWPGLSRNSLSVPGRPKSASVRLNTEKIRIEDVELRSSGALDNNTVLFSFDAQSSVNSLGDDDNPGQPVDLNGLTVGPKTQLHLGNRSFRSVGDITIDGVLFLEGEMSLEGDILTRIPEPDRGARRYGFVLDQYGKLTFSGNASNEIQVGPLFRVDFREPIVVETGSVVQIAKTNAFDGGTGTLSQGSWVIQPDAQLSFLSGSAPGGPLMEIQEISRYAKLTVSRPPDGKFSVNGFPLRNSNLQNFGELVLDDVIVDFQGNTLFNEPRSKLIMKNGAKVIGNFSDVVEDVEGVIQLAQLNGAVDISSNAEVNGVLGVGASPGRGLIGGDLIFSGTSQLRLEVGGTEAGAGYDQVEVAGTANLDGKLILYPWDDYELTGSEQFEFIQAATISGSFAGIDQSRLGRNYRLEFSVGETGLMASAIPITINTYADWRAAFFTEPDAADELISGPDQDPDRDGMSNRMEYAVGRNPNMPEGSPVTFELEATATPDAYAVTASFDWANDVTDAIYFFEVSNDLEKWTEVGTSETGRLDEETLSRITVSLEDLIDATQRTFLRIGVKEAL